MAERVLTVERDGHVGRVWLNRPDRHNAITMEMVELFDQATTELEADEEIRAIVLRGRGGTFCSGFDLDDLAADPLGQKARSQQVARLFDRFHNIGKPTLAVIEGYATGGGFEFMLASDFAIAAEDARIGDFHIRRGLFGGAGPSYRVSRILGLRRAKELLLTGRMLTGAQALEWGLINDAVPSERLDEAADRMVATLTDKSPLAMRITKTVVNRSLETDVETLIVLEHLAASLTFDSEDAREGVRAFLEKRAPVWSGH